MNRTFTDLVKFISCIAIFIHHFFLESPIVAMFGYIACSIFFFLSAYGIYKSLTNKPMELVPFCKYRLLKIYKPLLLVNVLFIILTGPLCIGNIRIPIFDVFCNSITFVKQADMYQIIEYAIGLVKIDSVTWFLDVLLVSYFLIWGISKMRNRKEKNLAIIGAAGAYLLGCVLLTPPQYYWIDPIGIVIGLLFTVNDNLIIDRIKKNYVPLVTLAIVLLLFAVVGVQYIFHDSLLGRYQKCLALCASLLSVLLVIIIGLNIKMKRFTVITWVSSISYFIYLVHVKVANIVCYMLGHSSFILSLVLVICLSGILYKTNKILSYGKI